MAGTVTIHLDSSLLTNVISLKRVTLDCSKLFVEEETAAGGKTYKLCHNRSNNILQLTSLDPLRTTAEEQYEFLPTKIYVRPCMQEIFNKIVQANGGSTYAVVFGSPGVGKSVLSFLAVLCCVCFKNKPVLFLRKTTKQLESISVCWITPSNNNDGKLIVDFDRNVKNTNGLNLIHGKMVEHIFSDDIKGGDISKARNPRPHLRSMCDGPRHGHVDHVAGADLVTSGGYKDPKDEASTEINPLPLSAWTLKEVIQGCRHLFKVKSTDAKRIFDVCGGNIRITTEIIEKGNTLVNRRKYIARIVKKEGNLEKLKLTLESTTMSGTEESVDRLRTMFAFPWECGYDTVQYIGSPYLLRLVRSQLPLEETLRGVESAKRSGIRSLYGWHFELFGHKIFQVSHKYQVETRKEGNLLLPPACHQFDIVEGSGMGKESVKQLNRNNVYWTPSTSNFANIDAAIALNGTLYCIQYTVSVSHTFSCRTFLSDFWEELLPQLRQTISMVIVVFVVPQGVNFRAVVIPKSQKSLSSGITSADGINVVFRKAGSAATGEDNDDDENDDADDGEMEEDNDVEHDSDDDNVDEDMDEDMDDIYSDDDCGEEGFDEAETSPLQGDLPAVHFQWETRGEEFDVEQAPLSFLNSNN